MNNISSEENFNCMERIEQKYAQEEEQESTHYPQPSTNMPILLLITTMILTSCATALTCISLMTNHWEYITWDVRKVADIASKTRKHVNAPPYISVEPLLDETIVKLSIYDFSHRNKIEMINENVGIERNSTVTVYLVPMHGGIWTLCVWLNEQQLDLLRRIYFPTELCINYLSNKQFNDEEHLSSNWNYRMKNISISCALVCLILLGSAALIGTYGILKHQLSAILVTGVMYLLAGTFALFTLMILHLKKLDYRKNQQNYDNSAIMNTTVTYVIDEGVVQQSTNAVNMQFSKIWTDFYTAREFNIGWSYDIGILGVIISIITSIMWIMMAKVLRYTAVGVSVFLITKSLNGSVPENVEIGTVQRGTYHVTSQSDDLSSSIQSCVERLKYRFS